MTPTYQDGHRGDCSDRDRCLLSVGEPVNAVEQPGDTEKGARSQDCNLPPRRVPGSRVRADGRSDVRRIGPSIAERVDGFLAALGAVAVHLGQSVTYGRAAHICQP
jgi:hypothetical protein